MKIQVNTHIHTSHSIIPYIKLHPYHPSNPSNRCNRRGRLRGSSYALTSCLPSPSSRKETSATIGSTDRCHDLHDPWRFGFPWNDGMDTFHVHKICFIDSMDWLLALEIKLHVGVELELWQVNCFTCSKEFVTVFPWNDLLLVQDCYHHSSCFLFAYVFSAATIPRYFWNHPSRVNSPWALDNGKCPNNFWSTLIESIYKIWIVVDTFVAHPLFQRACK